MHIDQPEAKFRGDAASSRVLALAALLLALATACGAFGAHGLKSQLSPDRLQLWDTAVRYQFFHAVGLLGVGLTLRVLHTGAALPRVAGLVRRAALLIASGVVLFCGSLYALALGAPRALGLLTPLGGLVWIAAWMMFGWAVWHARL